MRFKVPQFVDMEDKIIGPITMRQLAILGGGGVVAYAAYMKMGGTWWIIGAPAAILAIVFAFVKIQDMSFFQYLIAMLQYLVKPEKRVWLQHSDYINPPADLFQKKDEKKTNFHEDKDKDMLKKIDKYASLLDGREDSLVFDSFHSEEKSDQAKDRISNLKASDTKSVQERVARAKKIRESKETPINHSPQKF